MASFPWFRMYSEARTDPKLESLPDDQFRVWFRLLCLASETKERGTLPEADYLLAVNCAKGDEALLARTIASLVKLKIIAQDEDVLFFQAFASRQYDKPSDAPNATAERKRQQRERARVTPERPDQSTQSEDVTPMSRDVTRRHDPDTDTERDTEDEGTEGPPTVEAQDAPKSADRPQPNEPPREAKPKTQAQLNAARLYERRMLIFEAFLRGLNIAPESLAATQRKSPSLQTLTPAILDTPECVPETIEPLTRYTAAAFQWRKGQTTPSLAEVLAAFPEWEQAGRPEQPPPSNVKKLDWNDHRRFKEGVGTGIIG